MNRCSGQSIARAHNDMASFRRRCSAGGDSTAKWSLRTTGTRTASPCRAAGSDGTARIRAITKTRTRSLLPGAPTSRTVRGLSKSESIRNSRRAAAATTPRGTRRPPSRQTAPIAPPATSALCRCVPTASPCSHPAATGRRACGAWTTTAIRWLPRIHHPSLPTPRPRCRWATRGSGSRTPRTGSSTTACRRTGRTRPTNTSTRSTRAWTFPARPSPRPRKRRRTSASTSITYSVAASSIDIRRWTTSPWRFSKTATTSTAERRRPRPEFPAPPGRRRRPSPPPPRPTTQSSTTRKRARSPTSTKRDSASESRVMGVPRLVWWTVYDDQSAQFVSDGVEPFTFWPLQRQTSGLCECWVAGAEWLCLSQASRGRVFESPLKRHRARVTLLLLLLRCEVGRAAKCFVVLFLFLWNLRKFSLTSRAVSRVWQIATRGHLRILSARATFYLQQSEQELINDLVSQPWVRVCSIGLYSLVLPLLSESRVLCVVCYHLLLRCRTQGPRPAAVPPNRGDKSGKSFLVTGFRPFFDHPVTSFVLFSSRAMQNAFPKSEQGDAWFRTRWRFFFFFLRDPCFKRARSEIVSRSRRGRKSRIKSQSHGSRSCTQRRPAYVL